jgi:TRAP-type C4-dicarboxylate transport system substrate-binding protein
MYRRVVATLLATVIALAAPAASRADEIVDGPKLNWKVALFGKPRPNTSHAEILKKHVEARTGGKWTITLGYDAFGGAKEFPDLLKIGAVQAAWIYPGYYPDRFPVMTVLELPFLPIPDLETLARVHVALDRHPAAVAEAAKWGSKIIMAGLLTPFEAMGRGKPPLKLADFKGMRVRALGGSGDAMRLLGATPTSMEATEVYTALERGVIDGIVFPTVSFGAFRLYELSTWWTENLSVAAGSSPLMANAEAVDKLPPQYKALLAEAEQLGFAEFIRAYKEQEARYIPEFRKKKLTFIKYQDDELATFRKIAGEPVWSEWVKRQSAAGIPAQDVLDTVLRTASAPAPARPVSSLD